MLSWERISKHEAIDSPEGVRKRVKPSIASALQDSVVDLIEQKVPDAPAQEEGNNRKKQNHTDRHDPVAVDRDLPTAPPTRLLAHSLACLLPLDLRTTNGERSFSAHSASRRLDFFLQLRQQV